MKNDFTVFGREEVSWALGGLITSRSSEEVKCFRVSGSP